MVQALVCVLVLLCTAVSSLAFDANQARWLVNELSRDAYRGRQSGHPGAEEAEYFLAERLSAYGVHHGGRGSYFQEFPLLVTQERKAELTLLDHPLGRRIPFLLGSDFALLTHSGSGTVTAAVVIVGHGYARPDKDRDDFAGVDVRRRIVVVLRGHPESPYDFEEDFGRHRIVRWAKERGAAAVVFHHGPRVLHGAAIPAEDHDARMPMLYIGDRVLSLLLDETGYTLKTYQEKIKHAPLPLETGKRMRIATDVRLLKNRVARNVLGLVPGTDPVLRNEVIVVGGHLDHVGVNAHGVIYNGANDNASGSGVVSELARVIAAAPLKRSVLFAHFGGEELGMLGSDYWVNNSTVPLASIVCMINFDMAGHGGRKVVIGGGEALGTSWAEYMATIDSVDRAGLTFYREDGHGASDNLSFMRAGVPAVAFWSEGDHLYYHHYSDDSRWISDNVLQLMGSRAENFLRFMGNRAAPMAYRADSLALLASHADVIYFKGITIDAQGTIPAKRALTQAAWVTSEFNTSTAELLRRVSEFRHACVHNGIPVGTIKEAVESDRRHKPAVFLAITEDGLSIRRPSDVGTLLRLGISLIQLSRSTDTVTRSAPRDVLEEARQGGAYALVPLDYNAPQRVAQWKDKAILLGTLHDFAASPPSVREGILVSEAMVILEVTSVPSRQQLDAIYDGRLRRVHLNSGTAPDASRLAEQRATYRAMYAAGMTRNEIIALTGGNLRRYLGVR